MAAPKFAARVGRLPEVLRRLADHPDGLPIAELAAVFGVSVTDLREDLLVYYTADPAITLLGLSRPTVLEFLGPDGDEEDPAEAEIVRLLDPDGVEELGVEYLAAHELALLYTAAMRLSEIEDNEALDAAIDVLAGTMLGEVTHEPGRARDGVPAVLTTLREAVAQHRRVRLAYSRAWQPGVSDRPIDPYRLVHTRRGWEVDAGLPDRHGEVRTFLLSHIRSVEPSDEVFAEPAELERLLAENRPTTVVRMALRHDARWAADMYAERVEVVGESDADFTADLVLLPPVEGRVGLITLAGGEETRVLEPAGLVAAGPTLAEELYRHHSGSSVVEAG